MGRWARPEPRAIAVAVALIGSLPARAWAQHVGDAPAVLPPPPGADVQPLVRPPQTSPAQTPPPPGAPPPDAPPPDVAPPEVPKPPEAPPPPGGGQPALTPGPPAPVVGGWELPHWDKGFVLVSPPASGGGIPFRLVLNHVSQFKYTNSLATNKTYTDHFGVEHDVLRRNDIQLTRDVFYFSGYAFDPRLDFNILVFTSTATLVATAAGYVGFVFHRAFALRAGFFSLPSVRSLTGNYPFFHGLDRGMSTNYFRPGFTQGVWANGEPLPGINYIAMIGNALNTLGIKSASLDENRFAAAASVWYDRNKFDKYWNDYEHHDAVALRLGTAFTVAREDRLSDLDQSAPENNATFISDGSYLFQTGSLAPNVTISLADFYLWAIDGGLKYRGFALNVEFYLRWLRDFVADGPLPTSSMFDWGYESSVGYFVVGSLELFARSALIHGPFATALEETIGFNWYPFGTRQVWITLEPSWLRDCPYFSGYYHYSVGQTGFVLPAQFLLRF
jgi:hypothetical protein